MIKNFLAILLIFPAITYAGSPDVDLHKKCIYPTVMIKTPVSGGGGVVVSSRLAEKGYYNLIFTAAHVIRGQSVYDVYMPEWRNWSTFVRWNKYSANLIRIDIGADVAVLSFGSDKQLPIADIDWNPSLFIGNNITKVGCGNNSRPRVDFGQITSLTEGISTSSATTIRSNICTYAGDSGCGVFHKNKLVGIQLATDRIDGGIAHHISYYVPVKDVFSENDLK